MALDYQGDRFTLGLDAYHYKVNLDNGSPVMVSFGKMKNLIGAPDASNNLFRGVNTEVENKSVAAYLRQLEKMGEDAEDYASIWGYTHGQTEPRFGLYVYPDFPFGVTDRVSNLELE